MIKIPSYAMLALDTLEKNGYSAHIVGGCVRDSLLGFKPYDYDITTNAAPEQICSVFSDYHTIKTGAKHGTVTVVIGNSSVEITTYRIDGKYTDNRRPDSVTFTDRLEQDLARRDFTINAMAYSPRRGITDCFGGRGDLEAKIIRCVGDADVRFNEDALRILRALRFASVLDFEIEDKTKKSIIKNKQLLNNIASERIQTEFFKLICGKNAAKIIDEYKDVIAVFVPQIVPMFGLEQHTKYHIYDVWRHSVYTLKYTAPDLVLRLAALFHDIGKPDCFTIDENGCGHFYSHALYSVSHTRNILNSLKCDNATKHRVLTLIEYHDACICETKKSVKKWLGRLGSEQFFALLSLQTADSRAHAPPFCNERPVQIERIRTVAAQVIHENECFSLKDLAVNGRDMIALGLEGKQIGHALSALLEMVINGEVQNEAKTLIEKTKNLEL